MSLCLGNKQRKGWGGGELWFWPLQTIYMHKNPLNTRQERKIPKKHNGAPLMLQQWKTSALSVSQCLRHICCCIISSLSHVDSSLPPLPRSMKIRWSAKFHVFLEDIGCRSAMLAHTHSCVTLHDTNFCLLSCLEVINGKPNEPYVASHADFNKSNAHTHIWIVIQVLIWVNT